MGRVHEAFELRGRTALVTGASRGLGRHFALTLARAGARIALAARDEDRLAQVADEIRGLGAAADVFAMDVTRRDSVVAALDRMGPIDIVVNNAGITATARALDVSPESWDTPRFRPVNSLTKATRAIRYPLSDDLTKPGHSWSRGHVLHFSRSGPAVHPDCRHVIPAQFTGAESGAATRSWPRASSRLIA